MHFLTVDTLQLFESGEKVVYLGKKNNSLYISDIQHLNLVQYCSMVDNYSDLYEIEKSSEEIVFYIITIYKLELTSFCEY